MGKKPQIKKIPIHNKNNIDKSKVEFLDYPIFCFKYLQDVSIKDSNDTDFFINFLLRLKKLSELGWKEIRTSNRHSFGTEQIPIKDLKPKKHPPIITPDVEFLTVFRASGDKRPFLGIQNKDIFHVIYIEANFCDIYDH